MGFGTSTPEQVAAVSSMADGDVVGSAFEKVVEDNIGKPDLPDLVAIAVSKLKAATRYGHVT